MQGGEKAWHHIKRGTPIRIEVGPRDIDGGVVSVLRRDKGTKDRENIPRGEVAARIPGILEEMQKGLYERALAFQKANTHEMTDKQQILDFFTPKNAQKPEIHGGFVLAPFVDDRAVEKALE